MEIIPNLSVGNLLFNDSRGTIREKLKLPYIQGVKGQKDDVFKEYYDYFKALGLFVYFDESDKLWAFEFFNSQPTFNGINVLDISYQKLLAYFFQLDPGLEVGYNDFVSLKYGIGATTNDDPDEENAMPEAFIIFIEGYYDRF